MFWSWKISIVKNSSVIWLWKMLNRTWETSSIPKSTYSLQNTSFRTLSDATDFHQYNVTAYWTQQGGQQNASQTSTITLLPNETAIKWPRIGSISWPNTGQYSINCGWVTRSGGIRAPLISVRLLGQVSHSDDKRHETDSSYIQLSKSKSCTFCMVCRWNLFQAFLRN